MRRISALVIGLAFIVLLSAPVQTEAQFVIGPPLATHEYEQVATELYDFMLGDVNERFDDRAVEFTERTETHKLGKEREARK